MDNKGHNYRILQMNKRHYGNRQDIKSLKRQIRTISKDIETLKIDRNVKVDTLKRYRQNKTHDQDFFGQINEIEKELKKIDSKIMQKELLLVDLKKSSLKLKNKNLVKGKIREEGKNTVKDAKNNVRSGINTAVDLIRTYADGNDDGTQAAYKTTGVAIKEVGKTAKKVGKKTYNTITYYPRHVVRKTVRSTISKIAKAAIKAMAKVTKVIIKTAAQLITKAIELLIASGGWIVLIILIVIVLLCTIIVKFDISWFIGGNTQVAQTSSERYIAASEYLASLQQSFTAQINREADGIPVYDNDVSNINDILVTYICITFDFDKQNQDFTEDDKEILKNIFYTMCDYEMDTKEPEDDTPDKNGKKPEPEVVSCTVTRHNLAWAVKEYEFTDEQKATLQIISQLSGGLVNADGLQIVTPGGGGLSGNNNMVSGYVPDLNISLTWPTLSNTITSPYGDTSDRGKPHKGVDVAPTAYGVAGDPVYAVADGEVKIAQWNNATAGTYVAISHDGGLYTRYLHMTDLCVTVGDNVTRGQLIGHMGTTGDSTGVHLHFDFAYNGAYINPMAYYNN